MGSAIVNLKHSKMNLNILKLISLITFIKEISSSCLNKEIEAKWHKLPSTGFWYFLGDSNDFYGNWDSAVSFCKATEGFVANITSEREYSALKDILAFEKHNSVWVNPSSRPEYFSQNWRPMYGPDEPDFSGECLYLSRSSDYLWRDTSCHDMRKSVICKRYESPSNDCQSEVELFPSVQVDTKYTTKRPSKYSTTTSTTTTTKSPEIIFEDGGCVTEEGIKCVFPFRYKGEVHNGCTTNGGFDARPWCPTMVKKAGGVKDKKNTTTSKNVPLVVGKIRFRFQQTIRKTIRRQGREFSDGEWGYCDMKVCPASKR